MDQMDYRHYLARYNAILGGAKPCRAVDIPVKTQWDVDQHHKLMRLQKGKIEKKETVLPPPIENENFLKRKTPFWFYLLLPKDARAIKAMVIKHINNRREAESQLVRRFQLTQGRSSEIFNHFAACAQLGKRKWEGPAPLNGNTRGLKPAQKKPKNKKSPCVEVISNSVKPGSQTLTLPFKREHDSATVPNVKKSDKSTLLGPKAVPTHKLNVGPTPGGGLKQGQSIVITRDRQRFYAGVKRILVIKLEFTDEQLLQILGKSARVKSVNSKHRTVTVELVIQNDKYEVVLPIDAVDQDLSL